MHLNKVLSFNSVKVGNTVGRKSYAWEKFHEWTILYMPGKSLVIQAMY